jgi:site-specific DNA recombinase
MKVAAYCRVSTDQEAQLDSLENQKSFFEDFVQKNGDELFGIYADEGISGKQMKNRTAFLQMMQDARRGLFDKVLVKDISRFARNTVDFLNAIRELKTKNIEVCFLSNNQTVLGNSEFILTIFSALAQEESANLSKRVKFGKKVNAKKGRVPNNVYGYRKVDTFTLEILEPEAEAIRKIFQMAEEGMGARRIGSQLEEMGVFPRESLHWYPSTIRRMLRNPLYKGFLVNNKTETVDFITGRTAPLPKDQWMIHERPELRIVPKGQWEKVQRQLDIRANCAKGNPLARRFSSEHPFSTLIRCGQCGYAFVRKHWSSSGVQRYYWVCAGHNGRSASFCQNRVSVDEEELMNALLQFLLERLQNKEAFVQRVKRNIRRALNGKYLQYEERETRIMQIVRLRQKRERYEELYAEGLLPIERLKQKLSWLERQTEVLQNDGTGIHTQWMAAANLLDRVRDPGELILLNMWSHMEFAELIEQIQVKGDYTITITLK